MEPFLIYIGKTALAASAFYLLFLVLFQNREQFVFNRIYLPVSLAISFVIPLLKFTSVQYVAPFIPVPTGNAFIPDTSQLTEIYQPAIAFEWYHLLFGIYILGVVIFLFNLLLGHYKALYIIKKSRIQELFNTLVNITVKDVHPFSFFNNIVLSEKTLSHPNLDIIVSHERIHVKEKHTLDIFITEVLFLLQWFNPFVWLIKDAVKNNLEYKTDAQIAKTTDVQTYQLAMVTLADKIGVAPFLTALNGSQLRNRIIMMKRKNKNKYAWLKQLIVLPLLAVLIMGLAKREVITEIIRQDTTILVQETPPPTNDYDISKLLIIIDGEIIPSNNPELKHINHTGENPLNTKYVVDIIEALNINIDDITSYKTSLYPSNPFLYIRTKNYIPGTNKEFDENTTRNIVLDGNKLKEEYYYAIDNEIVTKAEFEKQGKIGFKNVVFLTGKEAADKYGKENNAVIADATSGISNFIIKDQIEDWSDENQNLIFPNERTVDPRTEEFHRFISKMHVDGLIVLDPSIQNFPYVKLNDKLVTDKIIINENDIKPLMIYQPPWSERFGEEYKNGIIHIKTKKELKLRTDSKGNYKIADIEVSGIRFLDKTVLIQLSGLQIGTTIEVPGEAITTATKKLWQQGLFSDVRITASKIVGDNIWLDIYLQERPPEANYYDVSKSEKDDLTEKVLLQKGSQGTVRGKVTNEKGKPIEGASVVVGGRPFGVITDSKGNYKIEIEPTDEELIFGFLYHAKQKVKIGRKKKIDVVIPTNLEPPTSGSFMGSSFRMRNSKNELVKPIFLIKNKEVNIEDVDRHFVKSFRMLPDSTATRLHGEKGKNGIVVVTMKDPEEMQTISGRVTNEKGEPIIGASITEYDELGRAVHGTHSDRTGHYVYVIKRENSAVRVRHFDYQTKEIEIEGKEIIDVQLERNQFQLSEMKIVIDGNIIPSNTPELKSLRLTEESRKNSKYVIDILEALDINIDDVVFSKVSATSNNPELYIRTKNYKPGTNPEFEKQTETPETIIKHQLQKNKSTTGVGSPNIIQDPGANEEGEPASKLKYKIAGIEVSGIQNINKNDVIKASGLKVGEDIFVPGAAITNATKKLWQQGLFSDVRITASKIAGDDIWLDIYLEERLGKEVNKKKSVGNEPVYYEVEEMPEFPGGELALRKFLAMSVKYPVKAQEAGIQGKVYVSFVVDREGNVTDSRIEKGADESLDEEALRVVNSLPRWKPGTHGGKKVNVSFTVPIHFGLQDNKTTKLTAP